MRVFVCKREREYVCVCVCERERERESKFCSMVDPEMKSQRVKLKMRDWLLWRMRKKENGEDGLRREWESECVSV